MTGPSPRPAAAGRQLRGRQRARPVERRHRPAWLVAALQNISTGVLKLDIDTLSILYRLALSARLLKLDLSSFFLVAGLTYYPDDDPATPPAALAPTLATFESLRRTITATRAAPFSLAQLRYTYTGVAGPSVAIGYRPNQDRDLHQRSGRDGRGAAHDRAGPDVRDHRRGRVPARVQGAAGP